MVLSKFETLPAELIVEISDYFDGCDLYNTFYGLNHRINTILDEQCHRLHVSFVNMSKNKFDFYGNKIVPHISARVISLTLCGLKSSTPGQLTLFLSRFNSLGTVFIKLESLKLIDFIKSDVEILLPHFPTLTNLKYLSIGEYKRLMPFNINPDELFNENIILPISLRSLAFPYIVSNRWIQTSTVTMSFVEHLHAYCIYMNSLSSLLQKFPRLKRLTAVLTAVDGDNLPIGNSLQSNIQFHTLKYLNINITCQIHFNDFACFLRNVPELYSLSVEALNPELAFLEASNWETILPSNLSLFRFDLTMTLPDNPNHIELLEGFKSKYWLSRRWFVQCHLRDRGRYFRLSTVQSPIINILYWPDDEVLLDSTAIIKYPNVTHIELWWNLSKSIQSICPNVRSIQFYGAGYDDDEPFHENILNILHCSLLEHIIINDNLSITQERLGSVLLESSNNVHTLTCSVQWLIVILENEKYEWICELLSMRIHKLILNDNEIVLSDRNLMKFCQTFINLKELTMEIETPHDLFFLLNNLTNLTMANIELLTVLNDNIQINKWIQDNTILTDFFIHKKITTSNTSKIILWIDSRNTYNSLSPQIISI